MRINVSSPLTLSSLDPPPRLFRYHNGEERYCSTISRCMKEKMVPEVSAETTDHLVTPSSLPSPVPDVSVSYPYPPSPIALRVSSLPLTVPHCPSLSLPPHYPHCPLTVPHVSSSQLCRPEECPFENKMGCKVTSACLQKDVIEQYKEFLQPAKTAAKDSKLAL